MDKRSRRTTTYCIVGSGGVDAEGGEVDEGATSEADASVDEACSGCDICREERPRFLLDRVLICVDKGGRLVCERTHRACFLAGRGEWIGAMKAPTRFRANRALMPERREGGAGERAREVGATLGDGRHGSDRGSESLVFRWALQPFDLPVAAV